MQCYSKPSDEENKKLSPEEYEWWHKNDTESAPPIVTGSAWCRYYVDVVTGEPLSFLSDNKNHE